MMKKKKKNYDVNDDGLDVDDEPLKIGGNSLGGLLFFVGASKGRVEPGKHQAAAMKHQILTIYRWIAVFCFRFFFFFFFFFFCSHC